MIETMDRESIPREARLKEILRRIRKHQKEVRVHAGERQVWCYRCHRQIAHGDPYRYEVFYLEDQPVETRTHFLSCDEYHERPRLDASEARIVLFNRGRYIQELRIMSEEQLQDQEQETQDAKPRRKKKKTSSKRKASSSKTKSSKSSKGKGKAKASSKKKASKKDSGDESGARSSLVSTAEALSAVEGFNNRGVASTIKAMAKGETPSNDDMVALREHVKAEAARLRGEDNGSAASQLSSINRLVRRIERSTRS